MLMSTVYNIMYNLSLYCEMLLSICLNIDVVATIRQPFNRVHSLHKILLFMRVGFVLIFATGLFFFVEVIKHAVDS